jgi:hypothetical protein
MVRCPGPRRRPTNTAPKRGAQTRCSTRRVPILVDGEMSCNHQGMTVWARVLNWVRVHPWFAALAGLGIWVSGAAAVDVLETLDVWHPGGQTTELLGGLFGLPLTGVAVVVLFDHLERARWSPLLDRRRRTARGHLAALSLKVASLFDWRVQLSANHPRVPLTRKPIVLSGDAVGDPAIETIELLHSALIELEPGAEEHDLMRSIEWEEKRSRFPRLGVPTSQSKPRRLSISGTTCFVVKTLQKQ